MIPKHALSTAALTAVTLVSLLLAACGPSPTPAPPTPTQTTVSPSPTPWPTDTAVPTTQPTRTAVPDREATPTPTPTPMPAPLLGDPVHVGRGQIVDAAFTGDASALAIGWASGVSLVAIDGIVERWWRPTGVPVIAVDVHPQGQAVVAALADGSVLILDAATGHASHHPGAEPHASWGDVAWSPDGTRIAFQFLGPLRTDPIYLLDAANGSVSAVPGSQLEEGAQPFLAWSPESRTVTLASQASTQGCTAIVDVETGKTVLSLQVGNACASPPYAAWAPDGRWIAAAGALIDPRTGQVVRTLEGSKGEFVMGQPGWPIRFSADGAFVAAGGQAAPQGGPPPIAVWDTMTGQAVAQIDVGRDPYSGQPRARVALAFDHRQGLLVLYEDGAIVRWALGGRDPEKTVLGRILVVAAQPPLAWSADGRALAAANRHGGAAVWDLAEARLKMAFEAPLGAPALSPDGRTLALLDRDQGQLLLVDLDVDESVATLPGVAALPMGVAFSPDGRQVAYGAEHKVIVADVATGTAAATLEGHPEGQLISRVIWSPDGGALVTASGTLFDSSALGPLILWERAADGTFREAFRTDTTRAGYDCCLPLALFNPTGSVVALEELPSAEAADLKVVVYDRDAREQLIALTGYTLASWVSEEVLLVAEAQYDTRLARLNVRTRQIRTGEGRETGDNAYAPGGAFYARPNAAFPYMGRGIEVYSWEANTGLAQSLYDDDMMQVTWSPDGRWVGAVTAHGAIVLWPANPRP